MATSFQQTLDGQTLEAPKTRKSYTREFKLSVMKFYHEKNLYQTAKRFSINTKTIERWVGYRRQYSVGSGWCFWSRQEAVHSSDYVITHSQSLYPLEPQVWFNQLMWCSMAMANAHLQDNLDDYVRGRITTSQRRVLLTKWVGKAWEEISAKKEMTIRSFKKCGISVAIDGSEDGQINIESLDKYTIGESEDEATDDESDPFEDIDEDDMD